MGAGIFSIGKSAMSATQAMLDTVSHNISNVNTPGYSRQEVELSTESGMFTGAGFYGRGVKVVTVNRDTNDFLVKELNVNTAQSSADQTRLDKLKQLESVLPTGTNGLGYAANQVLNAFVDVANQPQDVSARQVVLARAQDWTSRMNTAGKQMSDLQAGVLSDMGTTVAQINSLTSQIAAVNQNIAKFTGSGQAPNDLLDQRDQLIKQLNGQVQVNTVAADDGTTSVFMAGGQLLVLSNQAQTLSVVRDATDNTLGRVALQTNGTNRVLDSSQITGGALYGLQQFQDNDLAQTKAQLNTFCANFADALNAQQALGADLNGTLQTSFDSAGNPVSNPMFTNTGDAASVTLALASPKGLAAASPLSATAAVTNQGTATIDSLVMARALPTTNALDAATSLPTTTSPLTVVFETDPSDSTKLIYRFTDSTGAPYKDTTPPRSWTAGSPINDQDPNSTPAAALFNLSIKGVPKAGDSIQISRTNYPAANNGNAMAMMGLRDKAIVSLDGTSNTTVTDAYSQMIGNLGVMVQGGQTAADISKTLTTNAQQTLASTAGVNLDEEAAKLIQYQQSYQAAAKVLQIAQSLFATLLQTAQQ
ncbi:MAG: flagellar hook-associated protein FlgK [Aquabacterium sp.]|uniref:flagellar hook-associated protein FlgK n=1 Tax=Aquabacterium sp. TaxID=1872578 RepID=UPI0011F5865B|nr:flagellar hook-associated protein FlgK [Aquabacterium sp.]TAK96296.1 MAG: flagellar hook-associated protein FlgK [Aquabacterium sp.]